MVPRASDLHLDPKAKPPPQTSIHDLSIASFITLRFESSLFPHLLDPPVPPIPLLEKEEFEMEPEAVQEELAQTQAQSEGGFVGAL